jgi:hypothetical protein
MGKFGKQFVCGFCFKVSKIEKLETLNAGCSLFIQHDSITYI